MVKLSSVLTKSKMDKRNMPGPFTIRVAGSGGTCKYEAMEIQSCSAAFRKATDLAKLLEKSK